MIDFVKLSDPLYWFSFGPGDLSEPYLYFFLIFFGLFVLAKILLRYMGRQYIKDLHKAKKEIFYRAERLFLTLGLLGLLWTAFRYEYISFFSARFWLLIWAAWFIIWVYLIIHYARYSVPQILEREKNREQQQKYSMRKSRK